MPSTTSVVSQTGCVKVMTLGKLCSDTVQHSYKKSKLHISELWFSPLVWQQNISYIKFMVVFAFKCCIIHKIKSAISNPQKIHHRMVAWHDNVHEFALNRETPKSITSIRKKCYVMKNTKEISNFHFQYKTLTLIYPPDSIDQTRELEQDRFPSAELPEGSYGL